MMSEQTAPTEGCKLLLKAAEKGWTQDHYIHIIMWNSNDLISRFVTGFISFIAIKTEPYISVCMCLSAKQICTIKEVTWTYSRTSLLNCSLLFPRNSPIICRLRPFLCSRKWATPMAVSGTKPRVIRKWTPLSGFLSTHKQRKAHRANGACKKRFFVHSSR